MASIQQSLNQLLGAVAGTATATSYLVRQTPGYKARKAEQGVENINKQFSLQKGTIEEATPEARERALRAGEKAVSLREEALNLAPNAERLENVEKAETSLKTLKEGIAEAEAAEAAKAEEQAIAEEQDMYLANQLSEDTRMAREEKRISQTIQNYIAMNDKITSQAVQTQNYQEALRKRQQMGVINFGTTR
jgi:hypothetical protein